MNIILLSGGSGKRLWPLSNDVRSKQFIKLFPEKKGYESMVQRVFRQIRTVDPNANITVATAKTQISAIHNQIGDVHISVEPCRRDTFPAIVLAVAYLHDVEGISEDESVVVCPVDPYVEEGYFEKLKELAAEADQGNANLVLMGIEPTYPSEKYGYILPETMEEISRVSSFREKPSSSVAQEYIEQGGLWNGGVFAFKLSYVLSVSKRILGYSDYHSLYEHYENLPKISFDYAVVEKEKSIEVIRYHGEWKDLGTWNTLVEATQDSIIGNGVMNPACERTYILNELDIPVLCMGLKNVIVSASQEGILVSELGQSSYIKPFVDRFEQEIRFSEKSWGEYRVINVEKESITVKVRLNPGHEMNYHSHDRRNEVWTVISGTGFAIIDGEKIPVKAGDILAMNAGQRHMVHADTELVIIEVQIGKKISVYDKKKYPLEITAYQE